jgi:hypothetical protein
MRYAGVALAVGAALAASCDAGRVVTGTTVSVGGQGHARDTLGRLFPTIMFNASLAPNGNRWSKEQCQDKLLSSTKPGTAIGFMLENDRRCWLIAQAQSDFVFNTGSTGGRGNNDAELPVVNDVFATGVDTLFLLNVVGTEPPSAPSAPSAPTAPTPSITPPPVAPADGDNGAAPPSESKLEIVVAGVLGSIVLTVLGAYGTYTLQQRRIAVVMAIREESEMVAPNSVPGIYLQDPSLGPGMMDPSGLSGTYSQAPSLGSSRAV